MRHQECARHLHLWVLLCQEWGSQNVSRTGSPPLSTPAYGLPLSHLKEQTYPACEVSPRPPGPSESG